MNKRKLRASFRKYAFGLPKTTFEPVHQPQVATTSFVPIGDQDLEKLGGLLDAVETSGQTEVIEFTLGGPTRQKHHPG